MKQQVKQGSPKPLENKIGIKKQHACNEIKVPFNQEEAEIHIADFMEKNNRPYGI